MHTSSSQEGWKFNFDFSKIKIITECNTFLGKTIWFPLQEPWKPLEWTSWWVPQAWGTLSPEEKPGLCKSLIYNFTLEAADSTVSVSHGSAVCEKSRKAACTQTWGQPCTQPPARHPARWPLQPGQGHSPAHWGFAAVSHHKNSSPVCYSLLP